MPPSFVFFFLLLPLLAMGQPTLHQVLPAQTHPSIDGSNDPHLAYVDGNQDQLNTLLLFFPGTNAQGLDYEYFLETAASLGYHVLALDYENDVSINLQVCTTPDTSCHRRVRGELWTGQDLHSAIQVDPANSILFRASQALLHLHQQYPSEQWGQFLKPDSTLFWNHVITAGHSQGAGHAAYGAFLFSVQRVIMISWTDWMYPGRTADWLTMPRATPDSAYYGFIHTGDASIFNGIPTTWSQLGMDYFGPIVSVDTTQAPFFYSHQLISEAPIDSLPTQVNFHNTTCVDHMLVWDSLGNPVYLPVWEYLLGKQFSMSIKSGGNPEVVRVFPNPFLDVVHLPQGSERMVLRDLAGKAVPFTQTGMLLRTQDLAPGTYYLFWHNRGIPYHQTLIKLHEP